MKKVAVSGGFDPLHFGHLLMFQEAKNLGDYLVVIINGDSWLMRKKGFVFMPALQRAAIIGALKMVDAVYIHDSDDDHVCGALMEVEPDIFANGGDRKSDNTPEVKFCDDVGIEMAFNVGGGKVESSTALIDSAKTRLHQRPWGGYKVLDQGAEWALKTLYVSPNEQTSLQSHSMRTEHWMLVEGSAMVATKDLPGGHPLTAFHSVRVAQGASHRIIGGSRGATIVEVIEGIYDEDDIIRYEDKYGRI